MPVHASKPVPVSVPIPAPERAPEPAQEPVAPPLPQRLRRRLAALSVVGALLVAWPLVQLLRYQSHELQGLLEERAALDPVARAVDVQRGLLAHGELARKVLRGQRALEAERRQRQGELDERVAALSKTLNTGAWERAEREAHALRDDWTELASRIVSRSIAATESDQAHRLLMEQALQVIDLVVETASANAAQSGAATQVALTAAQARPQLAAQLAALRRFDKNDISLESLTSNLSATLVNLTSTLHHTDIALAQRRAGVQQARALTLAFTATLALAALVLLWQVAQGLRALSTRHLPPARDGGTRADDRAEAGRLLQRLRAGDDRHVRGTPAASHEEPQATQSPPL